MREGLFAKSPSLKLPPQKLKKRKSKDFNRERSEKAFSIDIADYE